jgi:hypothetical protein
LSALRERPSESRSRPAPSPKSGRPRPQPHRHRYAARSALCASTCAVNARTACRSARIRSNASSRPLFAPSICAGLGEGVDDGPYWDVLTAFAEEPSFYIANDTGTLVCGPMTAEVADDHAFEEARRKVNAIDEPVEWYFTLAAETPVATAPGGADPNSAVTNQVGTTSPAGRQSG